MQYTIGKIGENKSTAMYALHSNFTKFILPVLIAVLLVLSGCRDSDSDKIGAKVGASVNTSKTNSDAGVAKSSITRPPAKSAAIAENTQTEDKVIQGDNKPDSSAQDQLNKLQNILDELRVQVPTLIVPTTDDDIAELVHLANLGIDIATSLQEAEKSKEIIGFKSQMQTLVQETLVMHSELDNIIATLTVWIENLSIPIYDADVETSLVTVDRGIELSIKLNRDEEQQLLLEIKNKAIELSDKTLALHERFEEVVALLDEQTAGLVAPVSEEIAVTLAGLLTEALTIVDQLANPEIATQILTELQATIAGVVDLTVEMDKNLVSTVQALQEGLNNEVVPIEDDHYDQLNGLLHRAQALAETLENEDTKNLLVDLDHQLEFLREQSIAYHKQVEAEAERNARVADLEKRTEALEKIVGKLQIPLAQSDIDALLITAQNAIALAQSLQDVTREQVINDLIKTMRRLVDETNILHEQYEEHHTQLVSKSAKLSSPVPDDEKNAIESILVQGRLIALQLHTTAHAAQWDEIEKTLQQLLIESEQLRTDLSRSVAALEQQIHDLESPAEMTLFSQLNTSLEQLTTQAIKLNNTSAIHSLAELSAVLAEEQRVTENMSARYKTLLNSVETLFSKLVSPVDVTTVKNISAYLVEAGEIASLFGNYDMQAPILAYTQQLTDLIEETNYRLTSASLHWQPPVNRIDGQIMLEQDIEGYIVTVKKNNIYFKKVVLSARELSYGFTKLSPGKYTFTVAAYDIFGMSSAPSKPAIKNVKASISLL